MKHDFFKLKHYKSFLKKKKKKKLQLSTISSSIMYLTYLPDLRYRPNKAGKQGGVGYRGPLGLAGQPCTGPQSSDRRQQGSSPAARAPQCSQCVPTVPACTPLEAKLRRAGPCTQLGGEACSTDCLPPQGGGKALLKRPQDPRQHSLLEISSGPGCLC